MSLLSDRTLFPLIVTASIFVITGCTMQPIAEPFAEIETKIDANADNTLLECPTVEGLWTSAPYDAISLDDDGEHIEFEDLSMTLDIQGQDGCRIYGQHTWSNGDIGATEFLVGVIDTVDGVISLHEVGEFPEESGTNGRMWGTLDEDGGLFLSYLGTSDMRGNAFATRLARGDSAPEPFTCDDINIAAEIEGGELTGIEIDGSSGQVIADRLRLEVVDQVGCAFRAINTWQRGDVTGAESLVGVIHDEAGDFILRELGPHPTSGTSGWYFVRHHPDGQLDLHYLALSDDGFDALAGAMRLADSDDGHIAIHDCPDLTGSWETGPFQVTRVYADGAVEKIDRLARELVIAEQIGCVLNGTNRWQDGDGVWHEEQFAGVMNAARKEILIHEFGPPPATGSTALILERLVDDNTMITHYLGQSGDGSYVSSIDMVMTRNGH